MAYRLLSTEPKPVEIGGAAKILVAPVTAVRMIRARAKIDREVTKDDAEGQVEFVLALAEQCIVGWEGIEDANGDLADITPDAIASLLSDYRIFEAFQSAVIEPYMERVAEKNDSGPVPSGTSAAGQPTAPGAEN